MATLEKTLRVAVGGQFMVFSTAIMLYHAVITEGAITIGRVLSETQLPLQTEPRGNYAVFRLRYEPVPGSIPKAADSCNQLSVVGICLV